ncbi:Uncharacterized protein OBRU01_08663 [Operophtera brumata]|uniref:Protein with SprT-like domain at the N terminus n=1 Tax=Operophtera brumata TaxID=104452 RepID=A0A0L7LHM9_OPEBR|nr:Uncharacterized protein OBRU01_08663 [Operophtera brumata]
MNLADPDLEYIDPTPNVHSLFIHFDTVFFWTKLSGKAVVRWSKRMFSSAGVCSYEGRGGICDIALSEPLLKLRPRKDLVETLLHEMIHAFLFVVGKDQSRDGHGPNFLSHMFRINQAAGINISVYHDFHDEVKIYQNHVWRCNGACQKVRPYFGVFRSSVNRAPGPSLTWWKTHMRVCRGTFIKCKEPEKPVKQSRIKVSKPNADIRKYINNNNATENKNNIPLGGRSRSNSVGVLETVRNIWANKTIHKAVTANDKNISTGQVNTKKRISDIVHSDSITPPKKINKIDDYFKTRASSILKDVYGKDFEITESSGTKKWKVVAVEEALVACPICNDKVRDTQINTHVDECLNKNISTGQVNTKKRISDLVHSDSITPPKKINKIDDYFKTIASSIVKDVYGKDFEITESSGTKKWKVVAVEEALVACLICNDKVRDTQINTHVDECLNKNLIEQISKDAIQIIKPSTSQTNSNEIKQEPLDNLKPGANRKPEKDITPSNRNTEKVISNSNWFTEKDLYNSSWFTADDLPTSNREVIIDPNMGVDCIDLTAVAPSNRNTEKILSTSDWNTEKGLSTSKRHTEKDLSTSNKEVKIVPSVSVDCVDLTAFVQIKAEPTTSSTNILETHTCPCCGIKLDKPVQEHLDECLMFFDNATPEEGASTSFGDRTIVIDDSDDEFDETQTYNATGTKSPCPNCMNMVENAEMNNHLDVCLAL